MRAILIFAAMSLLTQLVNAQDTIQRVDGSIQIVRIIETTLSLIRYVPIENPDGPIFSITKQAISKIVYEDGRSEFFNISNGPSDTKNLTQSGIPILRNSVSLNALDFYFGLLSVGYERASKSGNFVFRAPISIGLFNKNKVVNFSRSKIYSIGLGINYYYSFFLEESTGFIGLQISQGKNRAYLNYDPYTQLTKVTVWDYGFNAGTFYKISKNFELSSQLGLRWLTGPFKRIWLPLEINAHFKF